MDDSGETRNNFWFGRTPSQHEGWTTYFEMPMEELQISVLKF